MRRAHRDGALEHPPVALGHGLKIDPTASGRQANGERRDIRETLRD